MELVSMNRRGFLKCVTVFSAYLAGIFSFPLKLWGGFTYKRSKGKSSGKNPSPNIIVGKSRVVLVRNRAVLNSNHEVDLSAAGEMVTKGMLALTGESTPDRAWESLFKPNDIVGIKVNALGGKQIATHPGVVKAVVSGLKGAGVPKKNIIVWDRLTKELRSVGYTINKSGEGVRCFGTDTDYDLYPEIIGSIGSCFSKIISSQCTALINIPVLKDHDLAGVSISLKNLYGAIHNPNKYHDNNCNPYIADLNTHPYIKDKLRLVVCDAITLQYQGGPAYKPKWALDYRGLLLSQDPVAIDRIAAGLIEEKRMEKGLPSLKQAGREPIHIATAAKKGLGIDNLDRIELVRL
jgi:uncharacterized protein (DUF362 family)